MHAGKTLFFLLLVPKNYNSITDIGKHFGTVSLSLQKKKRNNPSPLGSSHCPVPTHFFQVLFPTANPDDIEVYALPNENIDMSKPLRDFKVSLRKLGKQSSIKDMKGIAR